jgi:hypothetical protein
MKQQLPSNYVSESQLLDLYGQPFDPLMDGIQLVNTFEERQMVDGTAFNHSSSRPPTLK